MGTFQRKVDIKKYERVSQILRHPYGIHTLHFHDSIQCTNTHTHTHTHTQRSHKHIHAHTHTNTLRITHIHTNTHKHTHTNKKVNEV